MKLFVFLTCLLFGHLIPNSFGQSNDERQFIRDNFPRYQEVLTYLNENIKSGCNDCYFGVAKKPDGYHLVIKEANEIGEVTSRTYVPVWSAKSGTFLPLDIDHYLTMKEEADQPPDNGISRLWPDNDRYDFMLFHGYPEWANDSKKLLSKYKDLSSQDYEILARAAAEMAYAYIHPGIFGNNFEFAKDFVDGNYETISPDRLNQFMKLANEALEYWRTIMENDPNYTPLVIKDLDVKIAHDYMHFYGALLSVQQPTLAKDFLNEARYGSSYIQYAKNLLDACSKNSFLFTNGDTDSYPIWYVQDKLGYRKDVIVMNMSLMQTPWYLTMSKNRHRYRSTLQANDYADLKFSYFLPNSDSPEVPFKQWLIKTNDSLRIASSGTLSQRIVEMPANFNLLYQGETIKIKLGRQYKAMADIALFDIIASNPDRSVFATSPGNLVDIGLWEQTATRGSIFEFSSEEVHANADQHSIEHLQKVIDRLSLDYLKGLGQLSPDQLYTIFYSLSRLPDSEREDKIKLFEIFVQKLPYQEIVQFENIDLIQLLSTLYQEFDPKLNNELKSYYASIAVDKIEHTHAANKSIADDIEDLRAIYKMYTDNVYLIEHNPYYELTATDTAVLDTLYAKVKSIDHSEIMKNLAWTALKVHELVDALEKYR